MKKVFLAAAMLFTIAASAQTTATKSKPKVIHHITRNDVSTIDVDRDDVKYRIEMNGEEITRLVINGKEIPASEYGKYENEINKIKADVKRDRERAEADREQADRDRERADRDREQAERDRARAEKDREQADRDRVQAEKDRAQAERDRAQAERDRVRAEEDRKIYDAFIAELISDKIIDSKSDLERITFSDKSLTVNGKELSNEQFKKYSNKYSKLMNTDSRYSSDGMRIRKISH
jgi:colicin import membrane protein